MRWSPYVPVRRRKANGRAKAQQKLGKGKSLQPIQVDGRKIAQTFWGSSWCRHLENFSDYSNRLPRGRTYARNGSIVHLEMSTGKIAAMVAGSELYQINIQIDQMSPKAWQRLCQQCSSSIASTIDLLRGKLPQDILNTLTDPDNDLFPHSSEIRLACDCPDWAQLCKHLAAVLYGIGNRLDDAPELLFLLRGVDPNDLIGSALGSALGEATHAGAVLSGAAQLAVDGGLEDIFGIELIDEAESPQAPATKPERKPIQTAKKKAAVRRAKQKSAAKPGKLPPRKATKKKVEGATKKKAIKKKALPNRSAVVKPTKKKK